MKWVIRFFVFAILASFAIAGNDDKELPTWSCSCSVETTEPGEYDDAGYREES